MTDPRPDHPTGDGELDAGRAARLRGIPATAALVAALAGPEPQGTFVEVRWRRPDRTGGMAQRFTDAAVPSEAATLVSVLGRRYDTYIGAAPRARRHGGRAAVERLWALWADLDSDESLRRLEAFRPSPPIVVRTSRTGRHAWWPLTQPLTPGTAGLAMRALTRRLHADTACTDPARILRPPGSLNFKYEPAWLVTLEHYSRERLHPGTLLSRLPRPPEPAAKREHDRRREHTGDPLLTLAPAVYLEALTGQPVGRDGKTNCPFRQDQVPSLHCYPDPARGWYCYSCRRGGSVYDLAAQL